MQGPGAFVRGIQNGTVSLFRHSSEGMFTSVTDWGSSVARNIDKLTFDSQYIQYREQKMKRYHERGFVTGVKGLGHGVYSGITGIVTQPIEGVYKEGVSGLFKGVGKGMIGVVAKPFGSAIDLIAQTSQRCAFFYLIEFNV